MTQQTKRHISLAGIFAFAAWLIWGLGEDWLIGAVPALYVGYIAAAVGVAGLLGLNIWHGGPLDKRRDAALEGRASPQE